MEIINAQKKVHELIEHYGGYWEPLSMMARITEETGELSRAMNINRNFEKCKGVYDSEEKQEDNSNEF